MGKSMPDQGMNTLIQQKDFQRIPGRRVPFLNCLYIEPNITKYHSIPLYSILIMLILNSIAYENKIKKLLFILLDRGQTISESHPSVVSG